MTEKYSKDWLVEKGIDAISGIVQLLISGAILAGIAWLATNINFSSFSEILFSKTLNLSYVEFILLFIIFYVLLRIVDVKTVIKRRLTPPMVSMKLNQGDSINLGSIKVHLDDVSKDGPDLHAGISIFLTDGKNEEFHDKYKISEDTDEIIDFGPYKLIIRVGTIMAGYTFGAKWAEIKIWYLKK